MARNTVNIQELLSVEPQKIIETLSAENSKLRLDSMAQQAVINRLVAAISDMQTELESIEKPTSQRSSKKTIDKTAEISGDDF
jgi:hypothetical protein